MLSPGFVQVSAELNISVPVLAEATGWLILCIGLGLFITNPLAKIVGRRPVYVIAICIMFATSVWGAAVTDYQGFLASRIVAGLGMAPYEVLVQCTIGDLYFVHERATRIAVWNLFLLTGISAGGLVAGYIIELDGYRWTFGACAIFFGVLMFAVVLLVPETAYNRDSVTLVPETTTKTAKEDTTTEAESQKSPTHFLKLGHEHDLMSAQHHDDEKELRPYTAESSANEKRHSYVRSLRIFTGRYTQAPIWKVFARPFVLLFYPAVFWGFLLYGKSCSSSIPIMFKLTQAPRHNIDLDCRLLCRQLVRLQRRAL
jgi:MFS family permease